MNPGLGCIGGRNRDSRFPAVRRSILSKRTCWIAEGVRGRGGEGERNPGRGDTETR